MNITVKRFLGLFSGAVLFISLAVTPVHAASPWVKETTYGGKTRGKFVFGLKNTLFGWMAPWAEARAPQYKSEWEGFSAGIGEAVVDTAAGVVQLATFMIPADFPDIGYGLPIPAPNWRPPVYAKKQKGNSPAPAAK